MVRDFFIVYWYNLLYICHLLTSYKKCIIERFFIVYWYNLLYICHLLASYKKRIRG